jgi:iodotyrosine deiodinase
MMGSTEPGFLPLDYEERSQDEMLARAEAFHELMSRRRTVRSMSSRPVPLECIDRAVRTAATAPSGANQQPWKFVIVDDPMLKREIREAAEAEEKANYESRFPERWVEALSPLGVDWKKPFLEEAPLLIVVFKEAHGIDAQGNKVTHYYVNESAGIACGMLIAALHNMGLTTLTYTPNPMGFLSRILQRPPNERPVMVLPVGYPAEGATVPNIARKSADEVVQWNIGGRLP